MKHKKTGFKGLQKRILAVWMAMILLGSSLSTTAFATEDGMDSGSVSEQTVQTDVERPQSEEAPQREDAPTKEDAPQREDAPTKADAPEREDAPQREDAPTKEDAPQKENMPPKEDELLEEETLVEDGAETEDIMLMSMELEAVSEVYTTSVGKTVTIILEETGVVWASDDESVANVSGGVVTGVSNGTATITATIGDIVNTYTINVARELPATDNTVDVRLTVDYYGKYLSIPEDEITVSMMNTERKLQ